MKVYMIEKRKNDTKEMRVWEEERKRNREKEII